MSVFKELKIKSIVRKRRPNYEQGISHKVFDNKLNRDFTSKESTDFQSFRTN